MRRVIGRTLFAAVALAATLAATPPLVLAAVPVGCSEGELRTAMSTAPSGEVLQLTVGCTYTLTGAAGEDNNVGGDLDFTASAGVPATLTVDGGSTLTVITIGSPADGLIDIGPGRTITIQNITLRGGDRTTAPGANQGGNIFVDGSLTLKNVAVEGGKGTQGGGIYVNGTLTLVSTTINGNQATTGEGGGIYNNAGTVNITNSTISGNTSTADGGGIFNAGGTLTLSSATIANNTATTLTGGGLSGGATSTKNSILAGNAATTDPDCSGAIGSLGGNVIGISTGCTGTTGADLLDTDPLLGPLANNGGQTQTHALSAGSQAIDNTKTSGCPAVDQRVRPRTATCDSGAFEVTQPLFTDTTTHFAQQFIDDLAVSGVTAGCAPNLFCPNSPVTRGQMAVFLLNADGDTPPACTTATFSDVPCSHPFANWIYRLVERGITAGCGGGRYCPDDPVTRGQMAVFLLTTADGPTYAPPACTPPGPFSDVPCSNAFAPFVQDLVARGVTSGCGGGNYCPNNSVTRGEMAVFLVKVFGLPHAP